MEGSVHVGKGKVAEPLGKLFLDLGGRETLGLLESGGIGFEDALVLPPLLVFLFEFDQSIALARLRYV